MPSIVPGEPTGGRSPHVTDADLAAAIAVHAADATNVHGIDDTSTLERAPGTTSLLHQQSLTPSAHIPTKVSIVDGAETATLAYTNCTGSLDYTLRRDGNVAGRTLTSTGAGTYLQYSYIPATPLTIGACQSICVWVYVPDPAEFNNVTVHLYHDAASNTSHRWSKSLTSTGQTVRRGWNFMRVRATGQDAGGMSRTTLKAEWGIINRVIVIVGGPGTITESNAVTIGHIYAERHEKAKMIVACDRPYLSFYTEAYPDLLGIDAPVTFNLDIDILGSAVGTLNEAMTEVQVATVAAENGNSISFHGWTGGATSGMTVEQLAAENTLCIDWLRDRQYAGRIWRGAYVQNNAPEWDAPEVQSQILGSRSGAGNTAENMWPPADPYNIGNQGPDNSRASDAAMKAEIDDWFDILNVTHLMRNILVHKIHESDTYSTKQAIWDYFFAKLEAAVNAGWLEVVTFEDLFFGSGGQLRSDGDGGAVSSWPKNIAGDYFTSRTIY